MSLPELDYAYLADFAQVSEGKLSAIGASFTHMIAAGTGEAKPVYLAGRIRTAEGSDPVEVELRVSGPEGTFTMDASFVLGQGPGQLAYDGKVGLLFAAGVSVPIVASGLYEFELRIEGKFARRLAFSVELAD